jgi:hypothetical protein
VSIMKKTYRTEFRKQSTIARDERNRLNRIWWWRRKKAYRSQALLSEKKRTNSLILIYSYTSMNIHSLFARGKKHWVNPLSTILSIGKPPTIQAFP